MVQENEKCPSQKERGLLGGFSEWDGSGSAWCHSLANRAQLFRRYSRLPMESNLFYIWFKK